MRVSEIGRRAIQAFEGCRLTAYRDVVGVLTIGYGHTGADVREGQVVTLTQAEALLAADLGRFERAVDACVTVPLRQCEFDALVSLAFNIGVGAFAKSTLVRKLNAGDADAPAQFTVWNRAGGVFNAALLKRRTLELITFLGPDR